MKIPINFKDATDFISDNNLFQLTKESLIGCLQNWWTDDKNGFLECMNVDLETVLEKYVFDDLSVSFTKNYYFEPPMDYIAVRIRILDDENSEMCDYAAFYDLELEIIDDRMEP